MIKKLRLKNWKSHEESEFEFSDGSNVIVGIMGAGKSSILNAICFSLFGTFPELQSRKIKLEDVVKRGEEFSETELVFEVDNEEYTVRRSIEDGRTKTSEILKGDTLLESPQASKVTEVVENIIKMDYDLFIRAVYSEQNELDYFLTIPKGQRMKKIDSLLRLDKFENARSNCVKLSNKLEQQKSGKMSIIEKLDDEENIEDKESIKTEIKKIESNIENYRSALKEKNENIKKKKKIIEELEEKEKKLKNLDSEKKILSSKIDDFREDINRLEDVISKKEENLGNEKEIKEELESIKEEKEKFEEKLDEEKSEFIDTKSKIRSLKEKVSDSKENENKIKDLNEKLDSLPFNKKEEYENKIKDLKNITDSLSDKKSKLEASIESHSESINSLSGEECPICDTKLGNQKVSEIKSEKKALIKSHEEELDNLKKKISEHKNNLKEIEKHYSKFLLLKQRLDNIDKINIEKVEKELDELKDYNQKLIQGIEGKKKSVDRLKERIEEKTKTLLELESFEEKKEELEAKEKDLETSEKYLEKTKEKIKKIKIDPDKIKSERKELEELISKKSETKTKLETSSDLLEEKDSRLKGIEKNIEMLENAKNDIKKIESNIEKLDSFAKALEETQVDLREEFIKAVNAVMRDVWRKLYPYEDYTNIRLNVSDGDYVLQLNDGNDWKDVEGIASGGERSCSALVLRVAFAMVLASNLKWLILDEPTHNLDARSIEMLSQVLKDNVSDFVDQMFIITHEPRLENAVSGYLYRLNRPGNKTGPTKVEQIDVLAN